MMPCRFLAESVDDSPRVTIVVAMETTPTNQPAEYHAQLTANVDAWYADAIDHDTFRANQRAMWATIEASDCKDAVLALLRGES